MARDNLRVDESIKDCIMQFSEPIVKALERRDDSDMIDHLGDPPSGCRSGVHVHGIASPGRNQP
jgi:hypothetical protein